MACENCSNGCLNPQLCACDCTTCAEANSCDIPVGDTGPQGPAGPMGLPGVNGVNGQNGTDGTDGCTLVDMYISDGTDGNTIGDIIVTTGPTPTPCNTVLNIGNLIDTIVNNGGATIPSGIIVMWSGTIPNIPIGWQLADGTNSQPDLRGRFIASYLAGDPNFGGIMASGGALSVNLGLANIPAHTHDIGSFTVVPTITSDTHCHNVWLRDSGTSVGAYRDAEFGRGGTRTMGSPLGGGCNTDSYTHTHIVTTVLSGNTGDGTAAGLTFPQGVAFPILPEYYTLAYIIKL